MAHITCTMHKRRVLFIDRKSTGKTAIFHRSDGTICPGNEVRLPSNNWKDELTKKGIQVAKVKSKAKKADSNGV